MDKLYIYRIISIISFIGIVLVVVIDMIFKTRIDTSVDDLLTYLLVFFLVVAGVSEFLVYKSKRQ